MSDLKNYLESGLPITWATCMRCNWSEWIQWSVPYLDGTVIYSDWMNSSWQRLELPWLRTPGRSLLEYEWTALPQMLHRYESGWLLSVHCILFWFPFEKGTLIRGKEWWGTIREGEMIRCSPNPKKTLWKGYIRSGSRCKRRMLGVCSWLWPLPPTLSKSADFSACKIIFPLTVILTSWGYLEDNVSNNVLCLHHSSHRTQSILYTLRVKLLVRNEYKYSNFGNELRL